MGQDFTNISGLIDSIKIESPQPKNTRKKLYPTFDELKNLSGYGARLYPTGHISFFKSVGKNTEKPEITEVSEDNEENKNEVSKNDSVNGYVLDNQAKKKIKNYLSAFYINDNFNTKNTAWITFTTTTREEQYSPLNHDSELVGKFSSFLHNERKNHDLSEYLWTAERQDRGDLHFHAVFIYTTFVDVSAINYRWLKYIAEIGYKTQSEKNKLEFVRDITSGILDKEIGLDNELYYKQLGYSLTEKIKVQKRIKILQNIDFSRLSTYEAKIFRKYVYAPCHAEFKFNPIKIKNYLTKYISKNDSILYSRIWAASRGFTALKIEHNLTKDELINEFSQDIKGIREHTNEITDSKGIKKQIVTYTIYLKYNKNKLKKYFSMSANNRFTKITAKDVSSQMSVGRNVALNILKDIRDTYKQKYVTQSLLEHYLSPNKSIEFNNTELK